PRADKFHLRWHSPFSGIEPVGLPAGFEANLQCAAQNAISWCLCRDQPDRAALGDMPCAAGRKARRGNNEKEEERDKADHSRIQKFGPRSIFPAGSLTGWTVQGPAKRI